MMHSTLARMRALTSSSIASSSPAGMAAMWLKSKRRRSGATSEPAWRTCEPSRSRSTPCSRWVAEWLRRTASRRALVDLQPDTVAGRERATDHPCAMDDELGPRTEGVEHLEPIAALRLDRADVADLAAGLAVERRLLGDDARRSRPRGRPPAAVDSVGRHGGDDRLPARIPGRRRNASGARRLPRSVPTKLLGFATARALLLHHRGEALVIDGEIAAAHDVLRQIEGEPEGVVERETPPRPAARRRAGELRDLVLEQREPLVERLGEAALLARAPPRRRRPAARAARDRRRRGCSPTGVTSVGEEGTVRGRASCRGARRAGGCGGARSRGPRSRAARRRRSSPRPRARGRR